MLLWNSQYLLLFNMSLWVLMVRCSVNRVEVAFFFKITLGKVVKEVYILSGTLRSVGLLADAPLVHVLLLIACTCFSGQAWIVDFILTSAFGGGLLFLTGLFQAFSLF